MSLGLFLCNGSQHFYTYLFSVEFGRKKKHLLFCSVFFPPVKVLELTWIGSGLVVGASLSQPLLPGDILFALGQA